jgi:hypothetical protein
MPAQGRLSIVGFTALLQTRESAMPKSLLSALFLTGALLVFPSAQAAETKPDYPAQDDKAFQDYMARMQEHMQLMQKQMDRINTTSDPKQRQQLMQEHWQSMHEGMGMLRGSGDQPGCNMMGGHMMMGGGGHMMGGSMMGGGRGHMMGGMGWWNNDDSSPQALNRRQQMMGACMGMQQQMMDQMMQHQRMMGPR